MGELIRCMATGTARHAPEPIKAFLSSTDNTKGGFATAPGELSSEIIDLARAQSVVMRLGARTVPMGASELTFAKVASDPDIQVKAENAAFTEREISFAQMVLSAYTIGTLVTCSRELAEDAPNFPELVSATIAKALAVQLDKYTLQGTGSGEPVGLVNDSGISSTGTTAIGALEYTDLAAACEAIRVRNHEPSGIVLHPSSHSDVLLSTAGDGSTSERIWLAKAPTLENVNMLATTNMPLANGLVGDWTKLVWGIRTSATVEADMSGTRFDRHQIGFKIFFRGDFGVTDINAFHLLSGITS
jgi:HK97 family phage major capsid protein